MEGSILFVGNATVLIRFGGLTVLTDPNFLHRDDSARLGYGLRARRLHEPALSVDALPPVDLCVLSHLHEDHWDRIAEAALPRQLPIVTTPAAARHLAGKGFVEVQPIRTWQGRTFVRGALRLEVTAMPAQHGPLPVSWLLPDTMGSMLDFSVGAERLLRLYISGDTLVHRALHEIPRRYPDVDLALLHLGGTRIAGVLLTMDDRQGVAAMKIVRPELTIPIHYDDYDVFRSPLADFQERVRAEGLADRVRYLGRGEEHRFVVGPEPTLYEPAPAP